MVSGVRGWVAQSRVLIPTHGPFYSSSRFAISHVGVALAKSSTMSEGSNDNGQQSTASLSNELLELCDSELLSEEGLREIIERHGLTHHNNPLSDYKFFRVVCRNERVTEGIIRCLLEYFPDAASAINGVGWSPLHSACNNKGVTLNIIQILADSSPNSVRSVTINGDMPLHYLCSNTKLVDEATAIQILNFLIEKYPAAVRHADDRGFLPIHFGSGWRSPEFCRVLIELHPGSERVTTTNGRLPLHLACVNGSLATVEYLYGLYPDAIDHAAENGLYPIHYAIQGIQHRNSPTTAVEIVRFLMDCDPDQKLVQFQGKTLLDYACTREYKDSNIEGGIQVINVLFDAHPASIFSVSNEGHMPLHTLCKNKRVDEAAAAKIRKFLLEKNPDLVRHADNKGDLPIHYAAGTKSPDFCRVLIESYPRSERVTSNNGAVPLHVACLLGSLATVEKLYHLYPNSIHHATEQGHYPIHTAIFGMKHRDNPAAAVEIVQFLLDCDPNQILIQVQGWSLLHCACVQEYNDSNTEAGFQTIKVLFDAYPEAIEDNRIATNIHRYHQQVQDLINGELVYARQANDHRLMHTPDDNGQLPLHTALQSNVRLGSIKLLIKGNPSAIRNIDDNGALPLHVACEHHDSVRVVGYVLGLARITRDATDSQGNTALHLACRGAKHDTIALLLGKYDAASVSKRNAHDKLPINLLWESNAVEDRESVEYTGSIFQLVRANPEMVTISNSTRDAARNGKKRKFSHGHEE